MSSLLGTQALAALSFHLPGHLSDFQPDHGIRHCHVLRCLTPDRGGDRQETVKRVTTHGLILVFGIGILLSLAGLAAMDPVFRMMGASGDSLPLIRDYMAIWFAGAVCVTMPMVGNAAIRATGDTKIPAVIMTIVAVVNVILDPVLIFGLFGFPRLELQGAAIATVFANGMRDGRRVICDCRTEKKCSACIRRAGWICSEIRPGGCYPSPCLSA